MGITAFTASDRWSWRFRNRHGIGNKILHGEPASAPAEGVEPFRQKLNNLIRDEGLLISQVYNADESDFFGVVCQKIHRLSKMKKKFMERN